MQYFEKMMKMGQRKKYKGGAKLFDRAMMAGRGKRK